MKNIYGYVRVSTASQKDDRQWRAMEQFGISHACIFADKQSGKNFDRPAYQQLMERLAQGDTLVIKSLDRLGRNYEEMIEQLDVIIRKKDVDLVVLDMPLIDTRQKYVNDITGKLILNLVLQIFSFVSQKERELNIQRTKDGIAAAKARGVKFGRKEIARPLEFEKIRRQWLAGKLSERKAAALLGVSRPTFHKWTHE